MTVRYIKLSRFRNLKDQQIDLSKDINIVFGKNGSGKSSLLEAIYFLLTTKSFREQKTEILMNMQTHNGFLLFGLCEASALEYRIGIERGSQAPSTIRVNGENLRAASQLAKILPALCVDSGSFDILNGPPGERRRYMDWGVFHLEPEFARIWASYNSCLKQRNTLLRNDKLDASLYLPWERQLARDAQQIDEYRQKYIDTIGEILGSTLGCLSGSSVFNDFSMQYVRGWDAREELRELLEQQRERDKKAGFTQLGPHRADLKIRIGKYQAQQLLSRGQQKLLVSALVVSQAVFVRNFLKKDLVVFLDDVIAELDSDAVTGLLRMLGQLGVQIILSTIERESALVIADRCCPDYKVDLFQVEHGMVTKYDATLA